MSNSFAQNREDGDETDVEQIEEGEDYSNYNPEEYVEGGEYKLEETPRKLTKQELEKREKKTEDLARKLVKEKFVKIDEQRKIEYKEELKRRKIEKKIKKGKTVDVEEEDKPKKESRKERKLREKQERERDEREERDEYDVYDEYGQNDEEDEQGIFEDYFDSGIDTLLLRQKMVDLESEMWNVRHLEDAKKGMGGKRLLKLKIPNCYYLNSVIYQRGDFEFIYQLDFFVYYFHQRYDHRRKFYNMGDPTRDIAKQIMDFTGNTKYRKTNLNLIIDSIGSLSGSLINEYMDQVISQLNLEYLATGEIKINYKGKNQRQIYAAVKPSNLELRSLGNITFYTKDKKRIIEQIDASPFDSLLPLPEKDYMDSILKIRIGGDSLSIMPIPIMLDSLSSSVIPISNDIKIASDTISLENKPEQNSVSASNTDTEKTNKETSEESTREKEAVDLQPIEKKQVLQDVEKEITEIPKEDPTEVKKDDSSKEELPERDRNE